MNRRSAPRAGLGTLRLAALILPCALASAQNGDRAGEEQPDLPADLAIPAAPVLTPGEERATFALPPGFSIELVAAEPLVHDPVAMAFDEDGRIWVVEMRGFMPDADGTGETEPVGSIAVLSDEDGDGVMDRRTVFMDELVLPRAIAIARGGALVITPPELVFARDTDGDGRADERTVIDTRLNGIQSPEHAINGLLPTLDNWFLCVQQGWRYRFVDGEWVKARTAGGGQWGVTKDDLGRIYFNTNSDPLRADLFPSHYAIRNPIHGNAAGVNVRLASDFSTYPSRITPGVNRGYRKPTLRDDFTLATVTAACGPHVYRGAAFPAEFNGDAFVCEPSGNLVQRYIVDEEEGRLSARNAYAGREFLTSTDERFRPVNMVDGPDGGLYIVDLYRGILQHRIFMTSFLRKQVDARGLASPIGLGRIWRVVHESRKKGAAPKMSESSWTQLAGYLSHPNGWWRDTAQRLIVEDGLDSTDAEELVREALATSDSALGRMHALHALEGIDGLDLELLEGALQDEDVRVLHAAVRVSEPWLAVEDSPLAPRLLALARLGDARLRHQVLLSLGEGRNAACDRVLLALIAEEAGTAEARSAVLSGLRGRELDFLELTLAGDAFASIAPGRAKFLFLLARCIAREGDSARIDRLLELIATRPSALAWQQEALLEGVIAARPKTPKGALGLVRLAGEPRSLGALLAIENEVAQGKAREVAGALAWPGKPGLPPDEVIRPLTEGERALFERGRAIYAEVCAACHQASG
ncbi:MAG: dehydrogenase, partial [Planctomycetota bacterium]